MTILMVALSSCKDSEDVNGSDDYYYYLDIQSAVQLNLNDAADEDASAVDGARKGLEGWVTCFQKARLTDVLFCGDVTDAGDIAGNMALTKAKKLGTSL